MVVVLILILTGCSTASHDSTVKAADTVETDMANTITLGDISDDPIKKIERFQPLADYIAAHISDEDTYIGRVKIAPDIETMIQWLNQGEVDLYVDSLYGAMMAYEQAEAQPILRRWKGGDAEYYSVFFVRSDNDIQSIEDVTGHIIAFEEPFSTSGYMLPYATLIEQEFALVEVEEPDVTVSSQKVGYLFSSDDHNTIQWVISGRVDIGVVDNQTFDEIPEENQASLRIFAQTDSIPRQVVMAGSHLDASMVETTMQLLVDLDETEEGQAILDKLKTSQFDLFPEGIEDALSRMQTLYHLSRE